MENLVHLIMLVHSETDAGVVTHMCMYHATVQLTIPAFGRSMLLILDCIHDKCTYHSKPLLVSLGYRTPPSAS